MPPANGVGMEHAHQGAEPGRPQGGGRTAWPVRRPGATLTLCGLVMVGSLAGLWALGLPTNNSVDAFLVPEDPRHAGYTAFRRRFGSQELLVVGVERSPLLAPETLDLLARIETAIQEVGRLAAEDLGRPESLVTGVGGLHKVPLVRRLVSQGVGLKAAGLPVVRDLFLGRREGRPAVALLLVHLAQGLGSRTLKELVDGVDAALEEHEGPDLRLLLAGPPVLNAALDTVALDQIARLFPLLGAVALLMLAMLARSAAAALAIAATTLVSVPVTLLVITATGHALNLITLALPAVLLVLGSAASLHVHRAFVMRSDLEPPAVAAAAARRSVFRPCLLAALTTSAGFLALTLSEVGPIRQMGLFAGFGILFTLLVALSLLPAVQALGWIPRSPGLGASWDWARLRRRPRTVVAGAAALLGLAGWGVGSLEVDSGALGYLPDSHRVIQAQERLGRAGVGLTSLDLVVRIPAARRLHRTADLVHVARAEARLRELPGSSGVTSLLDVLALAREHLEHDPLLSGPLRGLVAAATGFVEREVPPDLRDGAGRGLPLARLLPVEAGEPGLASHISGTTGTGGAGLDALLRAHLTFEDSTAFLRLRVATGAAEVGAVRSLLREVEAVGEDLAAALPGARAEVTGLGPVLVTLQDYLIRSQLVSLGLAASLVGLMLLVGLRSWRLALLGGIPNLAALTLMYGGMGWAGWTLDVATVMVGAIALGIVVDDTVHLLSNYEPRGDRPKAVDKALHHVGWPMIAASVVCCAGFSVLGVSSFLPMRRFGLITALAMLLAAAGNLLLLPALLLLLGPRGGPMAGRRLNPRPFRPLGRFVSKGNPGPREGTRRGGLLDPPKTS